MEAKYNTKKICLVIPSLQAGGMERVMTELIKHFSERDAELHLVLYGIKRDIFYEIPKSVSIYRPRFVFNNAFRLFSTVRTLLYLRRKIKQIHPVSILTFGEYWNNLVLVAAIGLPAKIFVSDRCRPDKSLGWFHNLLRRRLYPRSSAVIAQTAKAKQLYSSFLKCQLEVIGNPIRRIIPNSPIERQNFILSVGRLINTKHHDRLIKIFLRINVPGWKLIIVGDNALKQNVFENLRDLIDRNSAEDKVILVGKQTDVDSYYLKSKIFAFTSSSEGFPNVVGEAMSAGLPVVSYDCISGPSEMIEDGRNGFLVPVFADDIFSARLQLLMTDESLRRQMGSQAQLDVQKFDVQKIGDAYFSLITS